MAGEASTVAAQQNSNSGALTACAHVYGRMAIESDQFYLVRHSQAEDWNSSRYNALSALQKVSLSRLTCTSLLCTAMTASALYSTVLLVVNVPQQCIAVNEP